MYWNVPRIAPGCVCPGGVVGSIRDAEVIGVQRKRQREKHVVVLDAEPAGKADPHVGRPVPHRAAVQEHAEAVIAILQRVMEDTIAAKRRDVVLVPPAQRRRITEGESLEERRRVAGDPAEREVGDEGAVAALESIPQLAEVPLVSRSLSSASVAALRS
jgi:hypothetical protein